jgi:cobalt-zinc-cadmium efflux system outer membrane protein
VRSTFLLRVAILMLGMMTFGRGIAEEMQREALRSRPEPSSLPRVPKDSKARRLPAVPLELPAEIEEDMAEGLSLDEAMQRLLVANRDLAVKYQNLPKARADILTAGLIENPAVFLDSEGIPYGNYSPQRPGQTSYGVTVIFPPLDVSGKRRKRVVVARRAEQVLEALYQDAVRQEIDRLYSAHVDVLEAAIKRAALRQAVERLNTLVDRKGQRTPETDEAAVRRAYTEIALREAEANLLQTRREFAQLLAVPSEQIDDLSVRGSLRDRAPPPPSTEELISLALQTRPDLAAFELSVERAQANVQLRRAEVWDDILTFYTPYQAITFPSQDRQTAAGWEAGGLAVVPIFKRNQGDIARAQANVTQLQLQLRGLREQVTLEVQRTAAEYALTRQVVQKYESTILPRVRQVRDEKQRRFSQGQAGLDAFLAAEQSYDEIVQRYLEALVNHRRSMLRLNTVVGQRILP